MRILVTFVLAALVSTAAARAEGSPLAPLDFLLGSWEATGGGAPGSGLGSTTFERKLGNKVVVRTNHADYPASKDRPASVHDDLMVIYATSDGQIHASYYDNEGHVIDYTVETADGSAVFTSGNVPGMGKFRLTYKQAYAGIVSGRFEIAPASDPQAFKSYLDWTMKHPTAPSR
ncbi:MAG TPA: hypothetical protein VFV19_05005 [Candidatus Polarisedimenticolaceae bacterium]|nr:hypothetical protein [Candidatus Polarisedimenticolaceae bacterium]